MKTLTWKLAVVCVACACVALSQTSRGTVTGTVLDPSGAVIAAARVTLTGVETGVRLSTDSNQAGVYRFDAVDLGVYELQVTHPGFRLYLGTGVNVEANRVTTFDPRLEVGAAETRIEVSGESSEILIKDSPLRGGNFQPREVRDLPLTGLNPHLAGADFARRDRSFRQPHLGRRRGDKQRWRVLHQWPTPARE